MAEPSVANRCVLLVGGPDSGKSNYIIRLWLAIRAGKGRVAPVGVPDHLEYLEAGAQKILSGEFVEHTPSEVYSENRIPCRISDNGMDRTCELLVPDAPGEKWKTIYEKREWPEEIERHISRHSGCLIFIRAGSPQTIAPLDWIRCERLWGQPLQSLADQASPAPTQTVIVDFLQFLKAAFSDAVPGSFRPRVGIVIAAWDATPGEAQRDGISTYIESEFPLLHQFIQSNQDNFQFAKFGLSIVGGDLTQNSEFRDRYLNSEDPLDSGYVDYEIGDLRGRAADLTIPVAWALGVELCNQS